MTLATVFDFATLVTRDLQAFWNFLPILLDFKANFKVHRTDYPPVLADRSFDVNFVAS